MAHLIACLGMDRESWSNVDKILQSGLFDRIYLIINNAVHLGPGDQHYNLPSLKPNIHVKSIKLNFDNSLEDLVPELYVILKKHFLEDKIQDLDMAVNITSGTGKEHSVVISTLMKLGYGIRLVDLDKDGNILEMM